MFYKLMYCSLQLYWEVSLITEHAENNFLRQMSPVQSSPVVQSHLASYSASYPGSRWAGKREPGIKGSKVDHVTDPEGMHVNYNTESMR